MRSGSQQCGLAPLGTVTTPIHSLWQIWKLHYVEKTGRRTSFGHLIFQGRLSRSCPRLKYVGRKKIFVFLLRLAHHLKQLEGIDASYWGDDGAASSALPTHSCLSLQEERASLCSKLSRVELFGVWGRKHTTTSVLKSLEIRFYQTLPFLILCTWPQGNQAKVHNDPFYHRTLYTGSLLHHNDVNETTKHLAKYVLYAYKMWVSKREVDLFDCIILIILCTPASLFLATFSFQK